MLRLHAHLSVFAPSWSYIPHSSPSQSSQSFFCFPSLPPLLFFLLPRCHSRSSFELTHSPILSESLRRCHPIMSMTDIVFVTFYSFSLDLISDLHICPHDGWLASHSPCSICCLSTKSFESFQILILRWRDILLLKC